MSRSLDVDQFLDVIQKMIDVIRTYDPLEGSDDRCDAWEKRLYAWHDVVLRITADARGNRESNGPIHVVLSDDDAMTFQDGSVLRDEVQAYGDKMVAQVERDMDPE